MPEPARDPIRPWFVLLCMGLSAFIAWAVTDHVRGREVLALQETVTAQQVQIGTATQAQGHVVDAQQLAFRVKDILAPELLREISRQGGRPVSVVAATGDVPATVLPHQPVPVVVRGSGFTGTAVQDRGGLPPLTAAAFQFDPSEGLKVSWQNRTETFRLGFAQWRTGGDGLRAAARLTREVDGQAEEIHLTAADAYVPASEIQRLAPVPKWSVGFGLGRDAAGRTSPNVLVERHLSRNWSIETGYVNRGGLALVKFTWGNQ